VQSSRGVTRRSGFHPNVTDRHGCLPVTGRHLRLCLETARGNMTAPGPARTRPAVGRPDRRRSVAGPVAIDPKACVGDPCFDTVDYVVASAAHERCRGPPQWAATAYRFDGTGCMPEVGRRSTSPPSVDRAQRAAVHAVAAGLRPRTTSVNRRRQVAPEALKTAVGSRFQSIPARTAYRIPSSAARSSARLRPVWRKRLGRTGINGSSRAHSSSVKTSSRTPRSWNVLLCAQSRDGT
jgi:hypothetical protein